VHFKILFFCGVVRIFHGIVASDFSVVRLPLTTDCVWIAGRKII